MNSVIEEMMAIFNGDEDAIMHYGMPRRSGRYPWGSGDNPYQHSEDFLARVEELKKSGWEETPENIKKQFGLSTTQYRAHLSLAKNERRMLKVQTAKSLKEDGLSATEIGRKMGLNESTVRSLLDEHSEEKMMQAKTTADIIRKAIKEKGMIDVGSGIESELGVSREKLNQALAILESEGYPIWTGGVKQVTNADQQIHQKVICPEGTPHKDIYNYDQIHTIHEYHSSDNGETFYKYEYPAKMNSNRLQVLLKDEVGPDGETGESKDGIIQLRRGVADLSLGDAVYSQVRILVDDAKYGKEGYLKGMAVYSDNMPDGIDVIYNTSKLNYKKAIKDIDTTDPNNPFGSTIKPNGQYHYKDENGEDHLGLINKRADEGDWSDWSNALPSQFLSKQSLTLAKKQLNLAKTDKVAEFDEINSLTNPTIKKALLEKFADECDAAAVHLQAAALPGQQYHVIVPVNSLKDTEVYAPNYESGTKIALIRYPHGGTFEIPILTVNNKNKDAINILGKQIGDAIAINKKNAERLSGADFDGDTVMAIPTHDAQNKVKITSTKPLKALEGFDNKMEYPEVSGMKYMTKHGMQTEMGKISNLITDMTLKGASTDELAAATKHSMVIVDAYKHKLNYKQSEIDNNIDGLKRKYQQKEPDEDGNERYGGASTLISRSKGQVQVVKRQGTPKYNIKGTDWYDETRPEGALIYKTADDAVYTYNKVNKKTGEVTTVTKTKMRDSTRMAETDDPYTLISDYNTPMERAYAEYASSMKALANKARKTIYETGNLEYNSTAAKTYKEEVSSLMSKLNTAEKNKPRERQAQLKANAEIDKIQKQALADGNELSKNDLKKISQRVLNKYRNEVGSVSRRDRNIEITDNEWTAIQAGAISESKLRRIINNADMTSLRERATPKNRKTLSTAKIAQLKALATSNYTLEQIASKTGLSTSTISKYLRGIE